MAWQSLLVDDFSGGFTDYVLDNQTNRYEKADNFVVTPHRKFKIRPGSTLFDSGHDDVLSGGNPRIGAIFNFEKDTKLVVHIASNLYHSTSGTWAALAGPVNSNVAFSRGTSSSYIASTEWNKQAFLTDSLFSAPIKIYRDENAVLRQRTAGLESVTLTGAINLANELKTDFNSHIADAVGEHIAADTSNTVVTRNAYDLQSLIALTTELLTAYAAHRLDATLVTPVYHVATSSANALASSAAPRTLTECLTRLDDIKTKYNAHDNNATAHGATGNYQTTTVRFPIAAGTGTGTSFIYSFHYYYTYQVGDVIYEDEGPIETLSCTLNAPNTNNVTISSIAVLSNNSVSTVGMSYDTSNIDIKIYRTANNGTTFYLLATLDNGTTSYVDSTSDATLITGATLYTTGGVVENEQPPASKYVHVVNGYGYWAHVKEGSQTLTNRVLQSLQDDPDSVPADFFIDVDDEITGLSSVQSLPVAFTTKTAYRLEGNFDELGRGGMLAEKITNASGCISNQSIVQTKIGLFYAGTDGFYWTDGYRVQKISDQWNDTFKRITSTTTKQLRITGMYEENNDRVLWGCQMDDSSLDNDTILCLDLRWGIKPDACFTTWSNGDDFAPTGLAYFNKEIVRADKRGFLFKHQYTLYSDPKINTSAATDTWIKKHINWDYKSISMDMGSSQVRKFVNRVILQAGNDSNTSIQINSINDDHRSFKQLKPIRWRGNVVWGDPIIVWGVTDLVWGLDGSVEEIRRFSAGELRCNRKQLQVTKSLINIIKSDDYGLAAINATAKTVTLAGAFPWPATAELVDYYISFAADSYVTNYRVLSRTSDSVLVYEDNLSTSATNASSKWVLRGYVKDERFHLLKYILEFTPLTDSQQPYSSAASYTGANA